MFVSAVWKAFVFAFHILEEVVKRMIHGSDLARVSRDIRLDQFATRTIVMICAFLPLFAFREFRRVIGEDEFTIWSSGK